MQGELFPEAPTYTGWFRPADDRSPWEPVCEAETYEECLARLIRHKPLAVPACEKVVLRKGLKP